MERRPQASMLEARQGNSFPTTLPTTIAGRPHRGNSSRVGGDEELDPSARRGTPLMSRESVWRRAPGSPKLVLNLGASPIRRSITTPRAPPRPAEKTRVGSAKRPQRSRGHWRRLPSRTAARAAALAGRLRASACARADDATTAKKMMATMAPPGWHRDSTPGPVTRHKRADRPRSRAPAPPRVRRDAQTRLHSCAKYRASCKPRRPGGPPCRGQAWLRSYTLGVPGVSSRAPP